MDNKKILKFFATEAMVNLRIDKSLSLVQEIGTRSRAEHLLASEKVKVNSLTPKSSYKVKYGDLIEVTITAPSPESLQPLDLKLDVLHEDSDLLVVNKPAGLVVHPAAGHQQDTLVNALIYRSTDFQMKFGDVRPGIVHRLDKETSGILVIAKNDFAHEALSAQFKERSVHRIYFALCYGCPRPAEGKISSYISRHPLHRKKFASVRDSFKKILQHPLPSPPPTGKWAITHYKTLKCRNSELSLLQLKLETGRTHQIRVHLSELGNPIVGDTTYGADRKLRLIKSSALQDELRLFPRFALHAAELGFNHPTTKTRLFFSVPWPEDLLPRLNHLGFYEST